MRVRIHEDKCVGAGQCVSIAPNVFDQREDDGIVVLLNDHPSEDLTAVVHQAARLCPAFAIDLEG